MPARQEILHQVAAAILALPAERRLRIAIDGVDGSGKSFFADELAVPLRPSGREIIRASVDGFHNPRGVRYGLGKDSPEGFFRDSYNYPALTAALLGPLGPGGNGRCRTAIFDHRTDASVNVPERQADPDAILIFDGIFLHRPELRDCWDFSIFLDAGFDATYRRMAERDGCPPDPHAPENRRYLEGEQLYLRECDPRSHATMVINNEDLATPFIVGGIAR
jgi:uridine kinase